MYYNQNIIDSSEVTSGLYDYIEITNAIRKLKGSAFKLYMYLRIIMNEREIPYIFSPSSLSTELGVSKKTIQQSFSELIEGKYLKAAAENNHFIFSPASK